MLKIPSLGNVREAVNLVSQVTFVVGAVIAGVGWVSGCIDRTLNELVAARICFGKPVDREVDEAYEAETTGFLVAYDANNRAKGEISVLRTVMPGVG